MTRCADALARYARCFETLDPTRLDALDGLFAPDARFKDPFNDVRGIAAIKGVFEHMYHTLQAPRFEVVDATCENQLGYLHWHFHFQRGAHAHFIDGLSQVTFDDKLRVTAHIDYWDPAEQVYRHVPLLGRVLGWVSRRLSADQ